MRPRDTAAMLPLTPELVLCAYAIGVFPMANDRDSASIHWIEPPMRGIIPLNGFHASRSLKKVIRQRRFRISVDAAFEKVIHACAEETGDRPRTWLNDELIAVYVELARRGQAHSIECWRDDRLVGGLYGVQIGAAFFGESMFHRERDASKVALADLVGRMRAGGFRLLDTQFVTDHLASLGAREITRADFRAELARAVREDAEFPKPGEYAAIAYGGSDD